MVYGVKKYVYKKGKKYGPYPKDPDQFYLYEKKRQGSKTISVYLGVGTKPDAKSKGTPEAGQESSGEGVPSSTRSEGSAG